MTIIFSISNSPTFNLAAEEYLFSEWYDDLLFLYVNKPSVIIGCNQAVRNEVDLEFCEQNQIQVVRRMSGGGAVFHDLGNLNFCFISKKIDGRSSLNKEFMQPIIEVLTDLGVSVEIGKRKDLWLEGKYKISGTASHVAKKRELHHGTLLYDTNLKMLEKALSSNQIDESVKAISSVRSTVKNLRIWFEKHGQFTLEAAEFFESITLKLAAYFNLKTVSHFAENEIKSIQQIKVNKYDMFEWTFKK